MADVSQSTWQSSGPTLLAEHDNVIHLAPTDGYYDYNPYTHQRTRKSSSRSRHLKDLKDSKQSKEHHASKGNKDSKKDSKNADESNDSHDHSLPEVMRADSQEVYEFKQAQRMGSQRKSQLEARGSHYDHNRQNGGLNRNMSVKSRVSAALPGENEPPNSLGIKLNRFLKRLSWNKRQHHYFFTKSYLQRKPSFIVNPDETSFVVSFKPMEVYKEHPEPTITPIEKLANHAQKRYSAHTPVFNVDGPTGPVPSELSAHPHPSHQYADSGSSTNLRTSAQWGSGSVSGSGHRRPSQRYRHPVKKPSLSSMSSSRPRAHKIRQQPSLQSQYWFNISLPVL